MQKVNGNNFSVKEEIHIVNKLELLQKVLRDRAKKLLSLILILILKLNLASGD